MSIVVQYIFGSLGVIAVITAIILTIVRSDDPARMLVKWLLTGLMLYVLIWKVGAVVGKGGYGGAFVGIPLTAVCGLILAIIWRHNITDLIASPFASLYNGGNVPPEPKPLYSTAQALQKQGRYHEAIVAARGQLARFPNDMEGHILIAEIQAQNLKDLEAAETTIEQFCAQPGHHPKNIAYALFAMADWYQSVGKDRAGVEKILQQIVDRLPNTEHALGAAQRLAHLASPDMLTGRHDERVFPVPAADRRLGLRRDSSAPQPTVPPEQQAADYLRHLGEHPLDWEAREKLASIYAEHYQRLDLAAEQLEQLIQQPNAPERNVVRWLNLLTDFHVRYGGSLEIAQATLQRIIDRNPAYAAAEQARNRMSVLKLEFRAKEKTQAVRLGSYDQNIGLTRERRNPAGDY